MARDPVIPSTSTIPAVIGSSSPPTRRRRLAVGRTTVRALAQRILVYAGLAPFVVIAVFPIYWMAITAFKQDADLYRMDVAPFWFHLPRCSPSRLSMQEFFYAVVYVAPRSDMVVTAGLVTALIRGDIFYWGSLMAAGLVVGLPIAILYALVLDEFIQGLTAIGAR